MLRGKVEVQYFEYASQIGKHQTNQANSRRASPIGDEVLAAVLSSLA
jgi:hypothetical protein